MKRIAFLVAVIPCLFLASCDDFHLGFPTASNAPSCEGNACGDIVVKPENPGYTLRNTGTRTVIVSIRFTFGLSCLDPTDVTLGGGQSKTFGNGAYCNPYKAIYGAAGVPVPPAAPEPVRISSFTINPGTISAGTSTVFHIVLDKAAPAGGAVVGFSSITNTGLTDTIVDMPLKLTFDPGVREGSITVHTKRITGETTDIIFTAFNAISKQSAELKVN